MNESLLKKLDWLLLPRRRRRRVLLFWALIAGKETRKEYLDDFGDKIVKVQRTAFPPISPRR